MILIQLKCLLCRDKFVSRGSVILRDVVKSLCLGAGDNGDYFAVHIVAERMNV